MTGATGATGASGGAAQALSAFSVPSAPVSDGGAVVFDVNAAVEGTAITHRAGSSDVVIGEEGTYYAQYSSTVLSVAGAAFPQTNLITFTLGGQTQSAGAAQLVFTASGQAQHVTTGLVFNVTDPPVTLNVISGGGTFIYSNATINVFRV